MKQLQFFTIATIVALVVSVVSVVEGGQLYGLAPSVPQLLKIDPATGDYSPVGNAHLPTELTGQQLSSIDAKNKIYYMVAFNDSSRRTQLIGLSLTTGELVKKVTLPFAPEGFVGVGQTCNVIPSTGDVIVSGRDGVRNLHHILQVNPTTGKTTKIAAVGDVDVLGGASAFDPSTNIIWLQLGVNGGQAIDIFGWNIITQKQVYQLSDTYNMETMNYDPVTRLMFGVGLQVVNQTDFYRILVTLDSKTGKFNVVGKIPGYFIIEGGVGAINPQDREIYCFLQKAGSQNLPFNLVAIDMNDASVKSSPVGCTNPTLCPWSIAYLP